MTGRPHDTEPPRMNLAPGAESRRVALRSIARIDATVRRDRQSARRERWLGEVEDQLRHGIAMLARLRGGPAAAGGRSLEPRLAEMLERVAEQRRRIAISRALLAGRVKRLLPKRVASAQPVLFRGSDADAIATARAVARRNFNPKRIEPGGSGQPA
jgi:predicted alpha/beta-hydrolase family hydrolase